jgi:hypothetical protein
MFAVILGFHDKQRPDLLAGHAANFDAFRAASIAAENSNSGLARFQKLRQEFDERFIGPTFRSRRLQSHLQRAANFSGDLVFARPRLNAHQENDGAISFLDLQHGQATRPARIGPGA